MQIPSQMAITRVGAPIWLAILVFCWCVRMCRPRATCCLPPSCSVPLAVPSSLLHLPLHCCPSARRCHSLMHARGLYRNMRLQAWRFCRGAVAAASAGMNSRNAYIGVRFLLGAAFPPNTHWHILTLSWCTS